MRMAWWCRCSSFDSINALDQLQIAFCGFEMWECAHCVPKRLGPNADSPNCESSFHFADPIEFSS